MGLVWYILAAVVGAAVGSFLNVCICRIPEENESIISPASRCPSCRESIKSYDNIPVLSYLILKGKCRNCGCPISFRYPVVEILTALMALLSVWKFGATLQGLGAFTFICALIVITFIDIDHQIIPDVISLPGIPIFLLAAIFIMGVPWLDAILGVLCGGGILYAIAAGYELITKREGMGGGDIKLLGMLGAFLGWKSLPFILLVSSLTGAVIGIALMAAKGRDMKYAVPFGPFLSMAAALYLFVGESLIHYFLNFV
jgi:leader peptidase (prepilin peptidase)/N-methyltransferase